MEQQIINADKNYKQLDLYLENSAHKKILLVCGDSIKHFHIAAYLNSLEERLGIKVVRYSDFKPNPHYESVVKGVKLLNDEKCSLIIAVGGGSAMDVAKCIKLYSNMDHSRNYLEQDIVRNDIVLIAMPTTAGTGSEATRFAVIYYKGEKQSVADESCIPSIVIEDPSVLKHLPIYQKKASMLDALCHAIESFWSVNSTVQSQQYSEEAIKLIFSNCDGYLANDDAGNAGMLKAANLAGRAINITRTTAGHAMCYKLTSLFGIAHGHAAALCVSKIFPYIISNMDQCIDPRGKAYLQETMEKLAAAFECTDVEEAVYKYHDFLRKMELDVPEAKENDYEILKTSVNPVRLKNNPVKLSPDAIDSLYHQILCQ